MTDYTAGDENWEKESYQDAEASYRAANEDFSAAYSIFKEQEGSVPTDMKTTFIETTCYAESLRDSSRHAANAMEAVQNQSKARAQDEAEKARAANNRCDFSS